MKFYTTSFVTAALVCSMTASAWAVDVMTFGDSGWVSTDTRVAGVNATTQPDIDSRIQFVAGPAGSDGSVKLIAPTGSDKATLAMTNTTTGFGSLADFEASYRWFKDSPIGGAPAPALKLGIQTSDYGSTGSSSRIGENDWDKVLIYEPYDNPNAASTPDGIWVTQAITSTSGDWWMFDRTTLTTVNAPHNSLTLAQWLSDATYGTKLSGGTIVQVQLGVGSGNADSVGYVDWLDVSFDGGSSSTTYNFTVPEPASLCLLGLGGLALLRRRR